MSRTYKYVGVSTFDGETKIRYTSMGNYAKILEDRGHRDIAMTTLPEAMDKIAAARYLLDVGWCADNPATVAALNYALTSRVERAEKAERAVDDPVALLKQITVQMAELNALYARLVNMSDEE